MPGPVVGVLQEPGVSGGAVSGVCHGTLGELYQGPLRAGTDPEIAVVSFSVDRHSWVYFTPRTTAGSPRPPALGEKSATAARLFLDHYGLTLPPGDWHTHSELPVGGGDGQFHGGHRGDAALAEASGRDLKGRLFAEPYFSGPVYSAETLTWDGRTRLLGVSSRLMSPEPHFREKITAFPVAFPGPQRTSLERWLDRVLAAIGYTDRFAHVEFVLTADGPETVEVNPRIGGALVGEGMCRALGVNVYEAMIEAACGHRPRPMDADLTGGPAVTFILGYPAAPGVFTGVTGLDRLTDMPGTPAWYPVKQTGDLIEHLGDSRGYAGIVYAEAATAELATHRAVAAANALRALTDPAGREAPGG